MSEWILRWHFPLVPVIAGVVLASPSLWVGLQSDDWTFRSRLLGIPMMEGVPSNPWYLEGYGGSTAHSRVLMDHGCLPWWADVQGRMLQMRILPNLTHMLDFRLWDHSPVLMHVHSLVWYAALIFATAVLYRRILGRSFPVWAAGLAALFFAIDDAHGLPVGWLANRNALLSGFFGVVTLISYDRWRRDGWRPGAYLAPVVLFTGLLSKEEAVCTWAYLLGYVLFLDGAPWRRRLAAVLPCALATGIWFALYQAIGYGASRIEAYIDPTQNMARFAVEVARDAPILLLAQLGFPPSDINVLCSVSAFRMHWLWASAYLLTLGVLLAPLVMRNSAARFWTLGMILSVLPVCAGFPGDRLLMFAGLGAAGLLAQWVSGLLERADWLPASGGWRRLASPFSYLLIGFHLVIAPLTLPVMAYSMTLVGQAEDRMFAALPHDPEFATQTAVFVSSGAPIADLVWIQSRRAAGEPVPRRILRLSAGGSSSTLTRIDATTLAVRPSGGYLKPPRWVPKSERPGPALSFRYLFQTLDRLYRAQENPIRLGDTIELTAATVEITDMTSDNRPAEATFHFRVPLEDPSLRWLQLTREGYRAFSPPAISATVHVSSLFE